MREREPMVISAEDIATIERIAADVPVPVSLIDELAAQAAALSAEAVAAEAARAEAEGRLTAWAEATSPKAVALLTELRGKQSRCKMAPGVELSVRASKVGTPIYVVRCANGHHESLTSHEHALELLVDSHRTRAEDTSEVHARLMAVHGCNLHEARKRASDMGRAVRGAHPGKSGEERDALVLAELSIQEAASA